MSEKLSVIIVSAVAIFVIVVNVYTAHKIIAYVTAATNAIEINHADQEINRIQDELHFLYQVCVDKSLELGVSASDCYSVAFKK